MSDVFVPSCQSQSSIWHSRALPEILFTEHISANVLVCNRRIWVAKLRVTGPYVKWPSVVCLPARARNECSFPPCSNVSTPTSKEFGLESGASRPSRVSYASSHQGPALRASTLVIAHCVSAKGECCGATGTLLQSERWGYEIAGAFIFSIGMTAAWCLGASSRQLVGRHRQASINAAYLFGVSGCAFQQPRSPWKRKQ